MKTLLRILALWLLLAALVCVGWAQLRAMLDVQADGREDDAGNELPQRLRHRGGL